MLGRRHNQFRFVYMRQGVRYCGVSNIQCTDGNVWMYRKYTGQSRVQFSAFDGADIPVTHPMRTHGQQEKMDKHGVIDHAHARS